MTSQNFHEDFTYYTNSIEAHAFFVVYVIAATPIVFTHCMLGKLYISSVYCRHVSTKRRLI